jgi:hypothetical protein
MDRERVVPRAAGCGSLAQKADQGAPSPDLVVFNGAALQYADNPIEMPTGDDVRLFVLNVGRFATTRQWATAKRGHSFSRRSREGG